MLSGYLKCGLGMAAPIPPNLLAIWSLVTIPQSLNKTLSYQGELYIRVSESLRRYDPRAIVWVAPVEFYNMALPGWEKSLLSDSDFSLSLR